MALSRARKLDIIAVVFVIIAFLVMYYCAVYYPDNKVTTSEDKAKIVKRLEESEICYGGVVYFKNGWGAHSPKLKPDGTLQTCP